MKGMDMVKVAVIILNWNGEKLLQKFLPSVVEYTPSALGKVVVVDNASEDCSVEVVKQGFPSVELVCYDRNYGFAGGYNRAVKEREEEIVVLLNSDVEVTEGWLDPLVEMLEKEREVMAVQPKIKSWREKDKFEYAGACGGYIDRLGFPFCRGRILNVTEVDRGQYDEPAEVFWCSGAALCIRRADYLRVGGLDEHFFAHMEEIDLCWRLRNQGGVLKVVPASVVYHLGGGSLPMNQPRKLFFNYRKNKLMLYKNLTISQWRQVRWQRWGLDLAALVLFLAKGEWKNARSVWLAYREFGKMKAYYQPSGQEGTDRCIYRGCIVFQYYFKHIRAFSQLSE